MLVGHATYVDRVRAFIERAGSSTPSILHISGEPGIGKTTVVDAALGGLDDVARVRVTGVPSERHMDLAALVTVVRALSDALADVPGRSAVVLRGLLDGGDAPPPMAISSATLQLLGAAAERRRTAVVIDDAQWVDPASLAALVFAARRLQADPFALLVVSRSDAHLELPGVERLAIDGLRPEESAELLQSLAPMSSSVMAACAERCAGNPLALRLMADALTPMQRSGVEPLPSRIPLGDALSTALRSRLDVLPADTRRALPVVALGASLTDVQLAAALAEIGLGGDDLEPARADGIVTTSGGMTAFTHPLLAEAACLAPDHDLRAAHRALAAVTDGDRRVWHLIDSGSLSPSEAVAELDGLAERAGLRRAFSDMAAAAFEAARRSTSGDDRARRLLVAGQAWRATASYPKSIGVLREALAETDDPFLRAEVADALADAVGFEASVPEAIRILTDAAAPVIECEPARAATLLGLASQFATLAAEADRAVALSEHAVSVAAHADDITRVAVRVLATHARLNNARPVDAADLADLDLISSLAGPGASIEVLSLAQLVAFDFLLLERWDDADALFDRMIGAAKQSSYIGVHVFGCAMRGEVLWRLGRWSEARAEANADIEHHLRLDREHGGFGHATVARVAAATGATADAARTAQLAVDHGERTGMSAMSAWGRHALGLAALAERRPGDALHHLDWIWRLVRRGGSAHPGILWWQGDLLDAFVQAGQLDDARRLLAWIESVGSPSGTQWPLAVIERGRALLNGDVEAARSSVARLVAARAPFEAARSRLVLASCADGDERRQEAERALDVFEALGATRWEQDARAMLGSSRPGTRTALASVLSPAELRVALAVGEGRTNRQAATALALSPKTVDAHLQAIYRKLDLRTRTELALAVRRELDIAIADTTMPTVVAGD